MNKSLKSKLGSLIIPGDTQSLVDAPFKTMDAVMIDLGVVVLLQVQDSTNTIDRIALSKTEPAAGAVRMSNKPFHKIKIPLAASKNALVKAISTGHHQVVTDWKYLFIPELSSEEARDNQRGSGIMCSVVEPFTSKEHSGALIFSFLCPVTSLNKTHFGFTAGYAKIVSEFFKA